MHISLQLHGNIIRNGNLEEKLAEMEKKMSSLVSLNQSLSEKNMKLKDKEGRLAAQLVEAQREVRLPQKRRAEGAAVAEEGGSSRAALAHIHISDNENRLEDYEAAAIKKKRVYFEASSECTSGPATAEVENHVPVGMYTL